MTPRCLLAASLAASLAAALAVPAASAAPKPLYKSPIVTADTPGHAVEIDIPLPADADELFLVVTDGGNGFAADWADWIAPRFILADESAKPLTELDWKSATSGWLEVHKNANVEGGPMVVDNIPVPEGIGTHANSVIAFDIPEGAQRFQSKAGIDQRGSSQSMGSSIQFWVFAEDPAELVAGIRSESSEGNPSRDPADAVSGLDVHPDLEATLFAAEPDLLSPSAIDIDHRGRIWVCEVVNYRSHKGKRPEGDRILILEDTDGDNRADKTTVFYQGNDVDSAHGICVLGDRVIVSAGEEVFFLIDEDGDDKSDRKEILFTKIGGAQHDHGIHAFHFGPDGKLYFNFGNAATQLCDADGNIIVDKAGNEVRADRNPYQQGMIFRCNLDGSGVETLAWNFRNNWEVAVDSFGRLWQSDNDDDGNRAVRINYVFPYGNYGFNDEITGAGWRDPRPGMEEEIPLQHWHLNDPGVVPNLLQTGAGSPTGIVVYEGDLLPEVFQGQMIHCDAGPNVVRAYPATPEGAGFTAETVDILTGTRDRWFRPSDVCVAPDGSLIVADWYDPGVGGHAMGDLERGRLFLVAPPGHRYSVPEHDFSTVKGALQALRSPNEATRYLAFTALDEMVSAENALLVLDPFRDEDLDPHQRARLFYLFRHIKGDGIASHQLDTLKFENPELRAMAAYSVGAISPTDESPRVRALAAIALRFIESPALDPAWAALAAQYDGKDRWYLEALGIGADLQWDARFAAYLELVDNKPHLDIVWRARCEAALPFVEKALLSISDHGSRLALVRSLHFHPKSEARRQTIQNLIEKGDDSLVTEILLWVPEAEAPASRVEELALALKDSPSLVALSRRYDLRSPEIVSALLAYIESDSSPDAARHLLDVNDALPESLSPSLATALGKTGDRRATEHLVARLKPETDPALARSVVEALALSSQGEEALLQLAKDKNLPESAKFTTAALLGRSSDAKIRDAIASALDLPPAAGADAHPPIPQLVQIKGDAGRGADAYQKATCATCHQVGGEGLNFGPDLTVIGNKLPPEALYESILYPSVGISHGYHGLALTLKSDEQLVGFIASETDDTLSLLMPGGLSRDVPTSEIASRSELEESLMPPGLAALLTTQEFADLVAYLTSLK
ncbi:ThuA domain-containing protein [soil metagenome]